MFGYSTTVGITMNRYANAMSGHYTMTGWYHGCSRDKVAISNCAIGSVCVCAIVIYIK